MSTAWTSRYALRTKGITSSQIRELLKITQKPGMISFAGGLPAPDVFPHFGAIRGKRPSAIPGWAHAGDGRLFRAGEQLRALDA